MSGQELTVFPPTTAEACVVHGYHWPRPAYSELHHVVPQAWQAFWRPDGTSYQASAALAEQRGDELAAALWAPETMAICPTGHRNVHRLIVAAMHELQRAADGDGPGARDAAIVATMGGRLSGEEKVAAQALIRFSDAGGSLAALYEAGLWGQA